MYEVVIAMDNGAQQTMIVPDVIGISLGAAETTHPDSVVALAMAPAWAALLPLMAYLARARSAGGASS